MVKDTYTPERDITPSFLSKVFSWIEDNGEVLVIMRYLRGGGSKDFALVRSKEEFEKLIEVCPVGTDTIVFRDKQLPHRGAVTEKFIREAKKLVPEGSEYMFVVTTPKEQGDPRCFGEFDYHRAIDEELREWIGSEGAFGVCPNFIVADHEGMISASKGGIDGPR